jgi:hypothetical protein
MVDARRVGEKDFSQAEPQDNRSEGDTLMIARSTLAAIVSAALLWIASAATAEETVSTFSLDALSFISFGDQQILFPASGSSIKFRFGAPAADGSVPFTIAPADVSIAPIPLPANAGTLHYSIAGPASGSLVPTASGRKLTFTATVRATLSNTPRAGSYEYEIPFSTEGAAASNAEGTDSVSVTGMRLVDGVWYGQVVGATTNETNAFPEPGTAVYTVLSGQFDRIP